MAIGPICRLDETGNPIPASDIAVSNSRKERTSLTFKEKCVTPQDLWKIKRFDLDSFSYLFIYD